MCGPNLNFPRATLIPRAVCCAILVRGKRCFELAKFTSWANEHRRISTNHNVGVPIRTFIVEINSELRLTTSTTTVTKLGRYIHVYIMYACVYDVYTGLTKLILRAPKSLSKSRTLLFVFLDAIFFSFSDCWQCATGGQCSLPSQLCLNTTNICTDSTDSCKFKILDDRKLVLKIYVRL